MDDATSKNGSRTYGKKYRMVAKNRTYFFSFKIDNLLPQKRKDFDDISFLKFAMKEPGKNCQV